MTFKCHGYVNVFARLPKKCYICGTSLLFLNFFMHNGRTEVRTYNLMHSTLNPHHEAVTLAYLEDEYSPVGSFCHDNNLF